MQPQGYLPSINYFFHKNNDSEKTRNFDFYARHYGIYLISIFSIIKVGLLCLNQILKHSLFIVLKIIPRIVLRIW